jgi:hypothetical protein
MRKQITLHSLRELCDLEPTGWLTLKQAAHALGYQEDYLRRLFTNKDVPPGVQRNQGKKRASWRFAVWWVLRKGGAFVPTPIIRGFEEGRLQP